MGTETPDTHDLNANPTLEQMRGRLASAFNSILVVDRSKARFFGTSPFHLTDTDVNPLGREKNRTMTTDTRHADDESDPREDAAIQFARALGHRVQKQMHADHKLRMLIVCEARMHGYLHRFIDDARVTWHAGDLAHLSEDEILKYLVARRDEFEAVNLKH